MRRNTLRATCVAAVLGSLSACTANTDESIGSTSAELSAQSAADRADLALHWAPIHYQDVDQTGGHALGGAADYITRYDFDGDLDGRNNWDHAGSANYPLAAHAYFSVAETSTHWFIVYMFFHPRDWSDSFFDTEHENDSEGLLITVARDGSTYGALKSAVTVAHKDFFSFVPAGGDWSSGAENVDGTLSLASYGGSLHPVTAQEAKGHGLKARPYYDIVGDGVVYYPSLTNAEVPSGPDDRNVLYKLVDIFENNGLWANRNNASLFASYGSFAGDKSGGCGAGSIGCDTNAANTPWSWDDGNDAPPGGALATDPAGLVRNYFKIPEAVSTTYTFNPYR
ncbi:hypothetical protein [Pendulispora albinea]|uniref:Lipoprotein n=1 Tax=Pendulispora albinea TaxID=2741071 RepID=A0ABZ2LY22_9BACT